MPVQERIGDMVYSPREAGDLLCFYLPASCEEMITRHPHLRAAFCAGWVMEEWINSITPSSRERNYKEDLFNAFLISSIRAFVSVSLFLSIQIDGEI